MKKYILVAIVLAGLLGLAASSQAQGALSGSISSPSTNASYTVGETVNFSATASGGNVVNYSYLWNFGDGSFGAGENYSKAYDEAGAKEVSVTITDFDGSQVVISRPIVIVAAPPDNPAPAVTLVANNADGALTVDANTSVTLSWSTQNATACTASGDWSGSRSTGSSEVLGTLPAGSAKTYTLNCTGSGGTGSDSVTVNVSGGGNQTGEPTIDLRANNTAGALTLTGSTTASTAITLSWTTQDATACTASGDWSGSRATSGSEMVTLPLLTSNISRTYTLTCTGPGGTSGDTVSVALNLPGTPGDPLVITNVRVTDITRTSVIVRWTTNRAATSRVIYDTVSHPSISGQPGPNYGYSSSTGTDTNKVIEHAVTVSNLSSGTQYYFRVISED